MARLWPCGSVARDIGEADVSHQSIAAIRKEEAGAVLIEFALTLPLLLLLVVGIFDFGFAFQQYEVVTNAAREGARMAVLPGYTTGDVEARVNAYLQAGGITGAAPPTVEDIRITPTAGNSFTAKRVTVRVDYTIRYLAPFAAIFGSSFSTLPLTAFSVMRNEVSAGGT